MCPEKDMPSVVGGTDLLNGDDDLPESDADCLWWNSYDEEYDYETR